LPSGWTAGADPVASPPSPTVVSTIPLGGSTVLSSVPSAE
jgi:hypothetical protein